MADSTMTTDVAVANPPEPTPEARAEAPTRLEDLAMTRDAEPAPPTSPSVSEPVVQRPPHLALGAVLAVALLVTVVVSLLLQEHNRNRAVSDEDWQRAAMHVRDALQPGDVIRIEPRWADAPRVFLDGADMDLAPEPQRDILDEYARVWVIAGFNRGDEVRAAMPQVYEELSVQTLGDVDVLLFEVPPAARPKFDFTDAIAQATVRRVWPDGRPPQACTLWRDDAWHCGRVDPHLYVGRRMRDMNDEPRRCIYAPPVPEHGWVEVSWPRVELGATLSGRVGLDNWAVRSERGSATEFEVLVDGERRFAISLAQRDAAFHEWSVDTSDLAGTKHAVTFRTRAVDFFDRFACFTARIPSL